MRRVFVSLYLSIALILVGGPRTRAADADKDMQKIISDWQRRQRLVRTARYVVSGTVERKEKKELPPGDPVRPVRIILLLDFDRHRHRIESSRPAIRIDDNNKPVAWYTVNQTQTYDGNERRGKAEKNSESKSDVDLGIARGDLPFERIDQSLEPIFTAHGVVPSVWSDLRPDKWPVVFDPEDFELLGHQLFQGRFCAVVRTAAVASADTSFDEFFVDTQRDSAILRHVTYVGSNPTVRTDVEWRQTPTGWWPIRWTNTWTVRGKVYSVARYELSSFEPNLAAADRDFTIQAEPGMRVRVQNTAPPGSGIDPRYPAETVYQVSPNGSWETVSEHGFRTFDGKPITNKWPPSWVRALLAALLVVAVIGLGCVTLRRRRALKKSP